MARLCVNPHAYVRPMDASPDSSFTIVVPRAGDSLKRYVIDVDSPDYPAVSRFFQSLQNGTPRIPTQDLPRLGGLGLVVDREHLVQRPKFNNPLVPHPDEDGLAGESVCVELDGTLGEADACFVSTALLTTIEREGCVWHTPSGCSVSIPWWPTLSLMPYVKALQSKLQVEMPYGVARTFLDAGIAIGGGGGELKDANAAFNQARYASVKVFPISLVTAADAYFRSLRALGFMHYDDERHRYYVHEDPVGTLLHNYAWPAVQKIVGAPIKPSYNYFSGYVDEATLHKHIDREPCEYTFNAMLGYRPSESDAINWPFVLSRDGDTAELREHVGDSVLFCGRVIEHSRPSLPIGHECDVLLLHFVDQDYTGALI